MFILIVFIHMYPVHCILFISDNMSAEEILSSTMGDWLEADGSLSVLVEKLWREKVEGFPWRP